LQLCSSRENLLERQARVAPGGVAREEVDLLVRAHRELAKGGWQLLRDPGWHWLGLWTQAREGIEIVSRSAVSSGTTVRASWAKADEAKTSA
jgi:hypothetical protein